MRYLDTKTVETSPASRKLIAVRERLVLEIRNASGKGKGKGKARLEAAGASEAKPKDAGQPQKPLDFAAAFALALDTLGAAPISNASTSAVLTAATLAIDVLQLLLQRLISLLPSSELESLYQPPFMISLADTISSTWDVGPSALLQKCRGSLNSLLDLSDALQPRLVAEHLRAKILVEPWNAKRTLNIFDCIMSRFSVDEMRPFAVRDDELVESAVLRRLTEGMTQSDETATLAGRIAVNWVEKVWATKPKDEQFWISPVADACRTSEKGRSNICYYLLTPLVQKRKAIFKQLMSQGGFLSGEMPSAEGELEASLAILKVGNAMGLIELDSGVSTEESSTNLRLPTTLLSTCLYHASPSLRCSALSLLVVSSSTSYPFPRSTFALLRTFYTYSLGDEDGEFRMTSIALAGKLLLRLRDSAWKAQRVVDKNGDAQSKLYVEDVRTFVEWWSRELLFNLNPAKPFRIKMNALRLLDLLFQANLDARFGKLPTRAEESKKEATTGYSSYRRTAPTPVPQFQAKHRRIDVDSASGKMQEKSGSWPFEIELVTAETTFTLLRLLLSTYTALRSLGISLLEQFPSPLPGYEGVEGGEKAKRELLAPALRMVRSGREAEASAGAGIVGLIWRKWVLESEGSWNLGVIGGWSEGEQTGPSGFAFLNSLMDLADIQLASHATDLGRAALTTPMHGTLLALRHLLVSIPLDSVTSLSSDDDRRALFHRALSIVERVWEVTAPVLAASAPEGAAETTDTEEARALRFEEGDGEMESAEAGDGSGGPMHKIILSATWRAMKEAGELMETILRLPSELGAEGFQKIWTLSEVRHIGDLFATWLARIRHRGAFMALSPCYSRACSALLLCTDWPEVKWLPVEWLQVHIDSIISQKISITRRSAGIPYCILGILTAVLPTDKPSFDRAFKRLFEIAESKSADILDESRVHAMNTLRTAFLDAKCANAVGPYIERGFLLAISMFWSSNWICRNVAMMSYASLVTRSFSSRRTNLDRDHASLVNRLTASDFFGRYPSLHNVLKSELEFSSREHLNDLPTSDLNSSLFSVLMLLSLLQSPNRVDPSAESLTDAFVPIVKACATSRVWKIRDAAGDALTGLIPPMEVAQVCTDLLKGIESSSENELHGRLVQVLRLLEASGPLVSSDLTSLHKTIESLAAALLDRRRSFAVRTTFLSIARVCASSHMYRSSSILDLTHTELDASRSWPQHLSHLPSAENFVAAAFLLALTYEPFKASLVAAGLAAPFLEVQRLALAHLQADEEAPSADLQSLRQDLLPSLIALAESDTAASECRITAIEVLSKSEWITEVGHFQETVKLLLKQHSSTVIVPLREALLPLIAKLVTNTGDAAQAENVLKLVEPASSVDESIESREAAALALRELRTPSAVKSDLFARLLLRLLQDDDVTVRQYAGEVVTREWSNGLLVSDRRSVELVLETAGPTSMEQSQAELDADLDVLSNPSSLLFAVEKPNIFKDDLLETELVRCTVESKSTAAARLETVLQTSKGGEGPLGVLGNELVSKWAYRLQLNSGALSGSYLVR